MQTAPKVSVSMSTFLLTTWATTHEAIAPGLQEGIHPNKDIYLELFHKIQDMKSHAAWSSLCAAAQTLQPQSISDRRCGCEPIKLYL